ncbi:phosphoribosyltransferase [Methylomagnum sp.]
MKLPFENRAEAGRWLGQALQAYAHRPDAIVLALPRGGVPVGIEVARLLGIPLDLMLVRRLGTPEREEVALGAVASGGVSVVNKDVVSDHWIGDEAIEAVAVKERLELERRERSYRGDRPQPELKGACVIVVDDGATTGTTLQTGIAALRQRLPGRIVAGIPVAAPEALARLREEADEVVCVATPEPFFAVGRWYRDFSPISDAEIHGLMAAAWGN